MDTRWVLKIIGLLLLFVWEAVSLVTYQKSTWNTFDSSLGVTPSNPLCSLTGFDIGPWWTVDYGSSKAINNVIIKGTAKNFEIRVGDVINPYGAHDGFQNNSLCQFVSYQITDASIVNVACTVPTSGRYLSVQMVENNVYNQLKVCDVTTLP